MEAGMAGQPLVDHGGLVGAVVVEHQMGFQIGGHGLVDRAEELAELDRGVSAMALAQHLAGRHMRAANRDVVPWRL